MGDLALRFFNNKCEVTHEKFRSRGYVIHHRWYIENDVRRENYPKGENGRVEYLKALIPMVEKGLTPEEKLEYYNRVEDIKNEMNELLDDLLNSTPQRFTLLKNGIHTRIDHPRNGLSRMKRENQLRLFIATLMTIKSPRKVNKKRK